MELETKEKLDKAKDWAFAAGCVLIGLCVSIAFFRLVEQLGWAMRGAWSALVGA